MKEVKLESISLKDFLDSYIGVLIYSYQSIFFESVSHLERRMAEVRLVISMANAEDLAGSTQPLSFSMHQAKEIITEEIPEEIWLAKKPSLKNLIKMMRWVDENIENDECSTVLTIDSRINSQDMFVVSVTEMGFNENGLFTGKVRAIDGEIFLFTVERDGLLTLTEVEGLEGMSIFTYLGQEAVKTIIEMIDSMSRSENEEKEEGFVEQQKRRKKTYLS